MFLPPLASYEFDSQSVSGSVVRAPSSAKLHPNLHQEWALLLLRLLLSGLSAELCQRFQLIKSGRVFLSRPGEACQVLQSVCWRENTLRLAILPQGICFQPTSHPPALRIIKPNFPDGVWHVPVTAGLVALGWTYLWQYGCTANKLEDRSVYLMHLPGLLFPSALVWVSQPHGYVAKSKKIFHFY